MRAVALAVALCLLVLVPAAGGASPVAVEDLTRTNRLLAVPPGTAAVGVPGEALDLAVAVTNPYEAAMTAVVLHLEVYAYAAFQDYRLLDDPGWPVPTPFLAASGARGATFPIGDLAPGAATTVTYAVVTSPDMPHGDVLAPAAFHVRTRLTFTIDGDPCGDCVMASRGHFTPDQWAEATAYDETRPCPPADCVGDLNLTYLGEVLGLARLNGVLPDLGFVVRAPLPAWPLYALLGGSAALFLLAAVLYRREGRDAEDGG